MNKTNKNFQRFAAGMGKGCNYSAGTNTLSRSKEKKKKQFYSLFMNVAFTIANCRTLELIYRRIDLRIVFFVLE